MIALGLFHSYRWHAPCYAFYAVHRFAGLACGLRPSPELPCKTRWGVVQLVGHLTVNEDGEGSNPSAPAKFFLRTLMLPERAFLEDRRDPKHGFVELIELKQQGAGLFAEADYRHMLPQIVR